MREPRLEIDPLALDVELQEHPSQYGYWADTAAKAQRKVDEAKVDLESTRSKIDREIRLNPEDYGLEKVTDRAVGAAVDGQPECKAAQKKLIDAKFESNLANGRVNALEHRKRALSLLVELWIREYYSERSRSVDKELTDDRRQAIRGRRARDRQDADVD